MNNKLLLLVSVILAAFCACKKETQEPESSAPIPDVNTFPNYTVFDSLHGEWIYYKKFCNSDNFSLSSALKMTFTDDNSIRITRLNPIDTTYYTASGEDGACVGFDFLNYGGSGHLTTFEKVGDTIIFSSDNWASCMPNGVGKEYWLAN